MDWTQKRLEEKERSSQTKKCYFDEELRTTIHVFAMNSHVCQCGAESVDKIETKGGWRNTPVDKKDA